MNAPLFYLSFSFYISAGILYLLQLIFNQSVLERPAFRLTILAWLVQTVMLGWYFSHVGYPFFVSSRVSYLFSGWVTALLFILANWGKKFQLLGVLILPLIGTFYLLSLFAPKSYNEPVAMMQSPWASVHVMFSFLALAVFSLNFILGIIFIIEELQLKYKVMPKIFLKWPSLEKMENYHARSLLVGLVLLTGGILTGVGWAKSVTGFYFFEDARQLWAMGAWLVYALFWQSRLMAGWRGRRGVLLSLIGFVAILFTFLGVDHG